MTSLSLCMIVRNEAASLPRCVESLGSVYDDLCIVDTGSTDSTVDIARSLGARVVIDTTCNDADGVIADFSVARNAALALVETEWFLQIDADEVIRAGLDVLASTVATDRDDAVLIRMIANDNRWLYPRLIRTRSCKGYKNAVHEFAMRTGTFRVEAAIEIENLPNKVGKESSNVRNLRICLAEVARDPERSWLWYNLAREHDFAGDHKAAAVAYRTALGLGNLKALRHNTLVGLATCYANAGDTQAGFETARQAVKEFPKRAEAMCLLGDIMTNAGEHARARDWYALAQKCSPPSTTDWSSYWTDAYSAYPTAKIAEIDDYQPTGLTSNRNDGEGSSTKI